MPFPEKKHQKANKDKTLKKHRKFYNIWCNTFYDQLHFIFISQAHSISHFFKQHFHKIISQKSLNIKISKIKPTRDKKHRNYFFPVSNQTHSNSLSYFRKQHLEYVTVSKPKSFSLDRLNRTNTHNIQLSQLPVPS